MKNNYTGRILLEHLDNAGIRSADLARLTGLSRQHISLIMSGKYAISTGTAEKLAKALPDTTTDFRVAVGFYGKQ
jgi:plasmid maintenance system antidote protein VapI